MELFGRKFFETKAVGEKQGYSYNGATFGYDSNLSTTTAIYYSLYRSNTDLRRCIEELYQTVGKDWYNLNEGENELKNSSINDILNYGDWFGTLKSVIIRDLEIAWNVFILPIENWAGATIGYQVLDPRTIRIVANCYWEVIKYIQTRGGKTKSFDVNELYHFKDAPDPDNEVLGISKVETLVYDIMTDKESWRSNYAFFKNNAIPSTLITLENNLSDNEIKSALKVLKAQFSWGANKHKISAAWGIKDVKQLSANMTDMQFTALRGFTTERICSSMWVPKTILGYSDGVNYSTSDNQYRKYIENTVRPLQSQLEYILNTLIYDLNPKVTLTFLDLNEFDFSQKITDYGSLLDRGVVTVNEIRTEFWLEKFDTENADANIIKQWYELLEDVWVNELTDLDTENANK